MKTVYQVLGLGPGGANCLSNKIFVRRIQAERNLEECKKIASLGDRDISDWTWVILEQVLVSK